MKNSELMKIALKNVINDSVYQMNILLVNLPTDEQEKCSAYARDCLNIGVDLFKKKIINEENKESIRNLKKGGIRG